MKKTTRARIYDEDYIFFKQRYGKTENQTQLFKKITKDIREYDYLKREVYKAGVLFFGKNLWEKAYGKPKEKK